METKETASAPDNTPKNKSCDNCSFYLQHYVITSGRLEKVACGHCFRTRRPDFQTKLCMYWKPKICRQIKVKTSVKNTIKDIYKQLHDISILLTLEDPLTD